MTDASKPNKTKKQHPVVPKVPTSGLEQHVKLQQMQEEFLAWLESTEKNDDQDGYIYRKVR